MNFGGETVKIETITAKNNQNIKNISKLVKSSSRRKELGLFVVEGLRLCEDALNSGVKFETLLITSQFENEHKSLCDLLIENSKTVYSVTPEIMQKISDTVSPQGVFGVIKSDEKSFEYNKNGKYLALVNLQDPSNLGAAARTAEALGLSGIIVCGGCDIYNPKSLRASMGAFFRMNVRTYQTTDEMFEDFTANGVKTFASTPRKSAKPIANADFSNSCVVLIGNEANGLDDDTIERCNCMITIPMAGRAESLNASAAAAIICYAIMTGGVKND